MKSRSAVMVGYFIAAGLAMEHDKNELFHFSRAHTGWDLGVELGYRPYVDGVLLKPKKYWRYLGFFFDRRLTFEEHIRYYSTKALTTVMAMRMLGNSTRGLTRKRGPQ